MPCWWTRSRSSGRRRRPAHTARAPRSRLNRRPAASAGRLGTRPSAIVACESRRPGRLPGSLRACLLSKGVRAMTQYWMLVSGPENFETSRARGFDLAAMKSRHRKKAERVEAGDRVLFYVTGRQAWGGAATVTGPYFEGTDLIWRGKNDDPYPFRFPIKPDVILQPEQFVPALSLLDDLEYPRRWPREHWHLAFQGNVHLLPREDFEHI